MPIILILSTFLHLLSPPVPFVFIIICSVYIIRLFYSHIYYFEYVFFLSFPPILYSFTFSVSVIYFQLPVFGTDSILTMNLAAVLLVEDECPNRTIAIMPGKFTSNIPGVIGNFTKSVLTNCF